MNEYTGTLSGLTGTWLEENSSWGTEGGSESEAGISARKKVLAATWHKRGFGWQITVTLTKAEADDLVQILDSIAGSLESMDTEEIADDAPSKRAIRKDCERWAALTGIDAGARA